MSVTAALPSSPRPGLTTTDYTLYSITVFAWGFSWIAMKWQVGSVPPEVSVFWRFVLAASVMFAWSAAKGHRLLFPPKTHIRFAALGLFIFSTNFTLFYYGAQSVPSGLLAVFFSTASIFNMVLGFILFRQSVSRTALLAACLGFCGVALMFWPQINGTSTSVEAAIGLGLCVLGTLSFCLGNMVSASTQKKGFGVASATTWGMFYGAVLLGLFAWLSGDSFAVDMTPAYLGGLVYLAIVASVIAFGSYLTLLGRIGSDRAGYATVLFPVVALSVSTLFEGYVWTFPALVGLAFVLFGNVLMLRR
ncbi:EamA-like transporter family protein [Roseibium hamelinense]|uniref:EamA-like transporter family protein n=1 Tax=Roseibium hamelinense TaxID=150831 RepID=A0A562T3P3_9HYPH|nr:EamA family transporter [Roseibium hamelinense]MTI43341.1 EamA family transporter [Roseibium hamelinense]TWI87540.1 EamA-like transporter family protein [Roseibium hamelinense]